MSQREPIDTIPTVDLYQPHARIHTRRTRGRFQRLRRYTGIPLLLAYFLPPWLIIDGRPAMLFDLQAQQFHILWASYWPQDAYFLALLLMLAAFALFTTTVIVGRLWCGFTCPQTVWTLMFMWAEHLCEGDRNQRIKLSQAPWSLNKALRKTGTHSLWLLIAFATGATFVGYFYGIRELLQGLATWQLSIEALFWLSLFVGMTYLNAGYLREQVCQHMCPYSRFQSAMVDSDTQVVSYDQARGEPRGFQKIGKGDKDSGDCIDCSWCVQVCPVDIDIRNGLQFECIDCGLCADACDNVMEKLDRPLGLIRFSSERELAGQTTRLLRPRLLGYLVATAITAVLLVSALAARTPLTVDVIRDRQGQLYQQYGDSIDNVYTVKINHMGRETQRFSLAVMDDSRFQIIGNTEVEVAPGEVYSIPVRLRSAAATAGSHPVTLQVQSLQQPALKAMQETRFISPQPFD